VKQEFDVVKLIPQSPFHLGEHGIGLEETTAFIHSDTLVAAIISAWVKFYGEAHLPPYFQVKPDVDDDAFAQKTPPFLISSAFPYVRDCYFFPRPLMALEPEGETPENISKLLKKASFISKTIFDAYIAEEASEPPRAKPDPKTGQRDNLIQKNRLQVTAKEKYALQSLADANGEIMVFTEQEVPRVTPDRITSASNIFYFARILFGKDCGYFFLIRYLDENIKLKFRTVMRLLGEQGLSGDRSSGHGRFTPDFTAPPITFEIPHDDPNHFISLSLLYPTCDNLRNGLLDGNAAYDFIVRDGWFYSPKSHQSHIKRRQKRRMFTEGSVFCGAPDCRYGTVANVKPPDFSGHAVFRWGVGFPVGVSL
jgi:CRISPR-associated protein Csm4